MIVREQLPGRTPCRRGAVLVEMAFVMLVFLLLLFGIMEYCRFTFYRQLVTNASREGARYAVVNSQDNTVVADTKAWVTKFMANMDKKMKNFTCDVYKSDSAGKNIGAADTAGFGEYICVDISLDYDPILPAFMFLNNTIKIDVKSLMYSEAN